MTARTARRGYTLFELIVVLAILLLLAVAVLPSIGAFRGDTRQRAAADAIRGELAVARARAREEGKPYRVALSPDGLRIRRAPDAADFEQTPAADQSSGSAAAVDYPFDSVTAAVVADGAAPAPVSENGWVTIATVQPDGTCREDTALVSVKDGDQPPLYIRVRGLTAASRIVPSSSVNGGAR